jgi:flagellar protein FliO/FliZ
MTGLVALAWAGEQAAVPIDGTGTVRSVVAFLVVFGLLGLLAWLVRRGTIGPLGARRPAAGISVERAVPLGERRSLVVVSVEGRRLLLGLSPMQVSLLAELAAVPGSFAESLDRRIGAQEPRS